MNQHEKHKNDKKRRRDVGQFKHENNWSQIDKRKSIEPPKIGRSEGDFTNGGLRQQCRGAKPPN